MLLDNLAHAGHGSHHKVAMALMAYSNFDPIYIFPVFYCRYWPVDRIYIYGVFGVRRITFSRY